MSTAEHYLASRLLEVIQERDHARDVAVSLEQQLARVTAVTDGWAEWLGRAPGMWGNDTPWDVVADIRDALDPEADQ